MKTKQPFAPNTALEIASDKQLLTTQNSARRQLRRQVEDLKVQVLQLAEHQMELTVKVLRTWLK